MAAATLGRMSSDAPNDAENAERVLEGVHLLQRVLEALESDPDARAMIQQAVVDIPADWVPDDG